MAPLGACRNQREVGGEGPVGAGAKLIGHLVGLTSGEDESVPGGVLW